MQVLILAQVADTYSTGRIAAALAARGHTVQLAAPLDCTVQLAGVASGVLLRGQPLPQPDVSLLRCAAYTNFGLTVVRAFETAVATQLKLAGAHCVNDPQAKLLAHDKFTSLQVLSAAGLPIPPSILTWEAESLDRARETLLGAPLVLKTVQGTWGVGVMRADSPASARSMFETLCSLERVALAQRYVAEAGGRDVRAIVLGDEVVGAFRRTAPPAEFRANIHRGARPEMITLPPAYETVAIAAAQALHMELAGVDLLETEAGPLVLEVNPAPGFKQIERLSDIDVAGRIAAYLERR